MFNPKYMSELIDDMLMVMHAWLCCINVNVKKNAHVCGCYIIPLFNCE